MRERILLMSPPNAGKTHQLVSVAKYVGEVLKKRVAIIDLEDKLEPMLIGHGLFPVPAWLRYYVAVEYQESGQWEEYRKAIDEAAKFLRPDDWIMVDRIDLSWPATQRWYTQEVKKQTMAERLVEQAKSMKKVGMVIPPVERGAWQVINEEYESATGRVLYGLRCNVLLTSGIKGADDDSPQDVYGSLGIVPRGQKELAHQPHSVFLLQQKRNGKEIQWFYTTAKDIPGREYEDKENLIDFAMQYVAEYVKG